MPLPVRSPPPPRAEQLAFNRRRWDDVCRDPFLASIEGRFETTHDGRLLYLPPPPLNHAARVLAIQRLLLRLAEGHPFPEFPVSTLGGVRVPDVGWCSPARFAAIQATGLQAAETAPEVCIEVLSPDNSRSEMEEKRTLYFDAGAEEVWECGPDGTMTFHLAARGGAPAPASARFPDFPRRVLF